MNVVVQSSYYITGRTGRRWPGNSSWESLAEPSPEQPRPAARFLPREKCGSWQLWRPAGAWRLHSTTVKIFKFTGRCGGHSVSRLAGWLAGWLARARVKVSERKTCQISDGGSHLSPVSLLLLLSATTNQNIKTHRLCHFSCKAGWAGWAG